MINLKQKLKDELKTQMKLKNKQQVTVIKSVLADILNNEKSGLKPIPIAQIIQKGIKKRMDSMAIYEQNGRLDLKEIEEQETAILQGFLPKQMSRQEIEDYLKEKTRDEKDFGKVMKSVDLDVAVAPRKLVSEILKELLK
ncbi:hypothetical protein HK103_000423 [Boothiomyces macroporosus]|uniref:Altered inheritance of mitochondria protein 41 n=1 Tax=Boothiomyces macroporosus TaxID=261099 RepID=A0AAD5UCG6_9FUNG|nr:hypothetical protein HK103_000423 [Boothiomyces macroporosus]